MEYKKWLSAHCDEFVSKKSTLIYVSALICYFIGRFIETSSLYSTLHIANRVLTVAAAVLLAVKVIKFSSFTKCELVAVLFGFCLTGCVFIATGEYSPIFTWLILVSAKDVPFKTICKTILLTCLIGFIIIVTLATVGAIPSEMYVSSRSILGVHISRRDFGFLHVNYVGGYLLLIYLSFLVINYKIFSRHKIVFVVIPALFFLFSVGSRTSATIVLLSVIWLFLNDRKAGRALLMIAGVTLLLCTLISLIAPYVYDSANPVWHSINSLLSNRLEFSSILVDRYGVTLFGQSVSMTPPLRLMEAGVENLVLDNSYLRMLLRYGVLFTLAVIGAYAYLIYRASTNSNLVLLSLIAMMLLCGVMESWLFSIAFNPLLLYLFAQDDGSTKKMEYEVEDGN